MPGTPSNRHAAEPSPMSSRKRSIRASSASRPRMLLIGSATGPPSDGSPCYCVPGGPDGSLDVERFPFPLVPGGEAPAERPDRDAEADAGRERERATEQDAASLLHG